MTVFVDDMEADFEPRHRPGRRYVMCHMIADTLAELHAMANQIGVPTKWFQGDHYDITKTKKTLALKAGARAITLRQLGAMAAFHRRGLPMPRPEDAVEAWVQLRQDERTPEQRAKIDQLRRTLALKPL